MQNKDQFKEMCELFYIFLENGITLNSIDKAIEFLGKNPKSIVFDETVNIQFEDYSIWTGCDGSAPEDWYALHISNKAVDEKDQIHLASETCQFINIDVNELRMIKSKYSDITEANFDYYPEMSGIENLSRYGDLLIATWENRKGYYLESPNKHSNDPGYYNDNRENVRTKMELKDAKKLSTEEFESIMNDIDQHSSNEFYRYSAGRDTRYIADMLGECNWSGRSLSIPLKEKSEGVSVRIDYYGGIRNATNLSDKKFSDIIKSLFKDEISIL